MAETVKEEITSILEDEEALRYEEEISRNPYILDVWVKYLDFRRRAKPKVRYLVYERALKCLPRSYKLWRRYLQERQANLKDRPITDKRYTILVHTYERALVHLHKMPRLWLDYADLVVRLKRGTLTRRTFDRALQALPVTQHDRVWDVYVEWVEAFGVVETAVKVYRRYLMFDPQHREAYVDYLLAVGNPEEAAVQLAACVQDDAFVSPLGHSKHRLWLKLCDLCAKHPKEVSRSLKVDPIIRSGLAKFTDEVGRLWCKLADFYIRSGHFERARDVYEEALGSVVTVRDFTTIFDTFAAFEESVLSAKMAAEDSDDDEDDSDDDEEDDDDEEGGSDVELRLARLERLMERRPLLLSSVLLRQNPHNVPEWAKRVELYKAAGDLRQVIVCYTEAVKTVDPQEAVGKPHTLWLAFARFYEDHGDPGSARLILGRAVGANFKAVDDLAAVWCGWGEMELRLAQEHTKNAGEAEDEAEAEAEAEAAAECYQAALEVLQRAVAGPSAGEVRQRALESVGRAGDRKGGFSTVQERVHKSPKVWTLYLDLEESLGTVDSTRAAYHRLLDMKIATPQLVLNFAAFLKEHAYFEEAFTAYEKGVGFFEWPHVKPIWHAYLDCFIERYGGSKLERARELFEACVAKVPTAEAADVYLKYAKLEEDHGLVRHAMAVYDRAAKAVAGTPVQLDMYRLYVKKAEAYFGVTRTREIHEAAIAALPDKQAQAMALDYANLERKLGEVDRARAVLAHGAQLENPKRCPDYWKAFHDFEVAHGNEDTFRDMLRVKRSVATAFANETFYDMAAGAAAAESAVQSDAEAVAKQQAVAASRDPMAAAEQAAQRAKLEAAYGAVPAAVGASAGERVVLAAQQQQAAAAAAAAAASLKRGRDPTDNGGAEGEETEMDALDRQAKAARAALGDTAGGAAAAAAAANPEEIDLDDDDDEEDGEGGAGGEGRRGLQAEETGLAEKAVPAAVFGGLAAQAAAAAAHKQ